MDLPGTKIRSIAIIDDDPDDYELVLHAVREIDPGISVSHIFNCEEAAKYRGDHFDMVLLDINMPLHNGFSWLKAIREHGYGNLPIVMYTNSLSPQHIRQAYEGGANLYFSKPDSFANLISNLKKLIQMDWTNPFSITQRYKNEGNYLVFG